MLLALLAFGWLGCSENQAVRLCYQSEQDLFEAEKALLSSQMRSNLTGSANTEKLIGTYGKLVDFSYGALDSVDRSTYPVEYGELRNLNFQASTRLLQLVIAKKQFDKGPGKHLRIFCQYQVYNVGVKCKCPQEV